MTGESEMNPVFSAIVNCVVGCNVGAADGQSLHVLRCDTSTGEMALVQTVKGVQGTNYFCFDRNRENLYTYIVETVGEAKRGMIVKFPFKDGKLGEMTRLASLPSEAPCYISLSPDGTRLGFACYISATVGTVGVDGSGLMKKGVIVINAARDALVNEKDMLAALAAGKVRKYVTDFPNATTAGQPGCLVIPHLGASTEEAEDNCAVMAVKEIRDFLENGNIVNSVNYPACSLGPVRTAGRVAICHRNEANMIGRFTSILGNAKVNIDAIANKSRGDFAYTLIDTDSPVPQDVVTALADSEAVIRVRVVK